MPRPKIRLRDMPGYDCRRLGNFKSYSSDLLFDFEVIYKYQAERFAEFMPDEFRAKIEEDIEALHKASAGLKVMNDTRIYLMTDFDRARLVLYNLETCLVDNLEMLEIVDARTRNDFVGAGPDHVVTLFIFKGRELTFTCDVPFYTAMDLVIAFRQENLMNAGAIRNTWYGTPRRKARVEERLLEKLGGE